MREIIARPTGMAVEPRNIYILVSTLTLPAYQTHLDYSQLDRQSKVAYSTPPVPTLLIPRKDRFL